MGRWLRFCAGLALLGAFYVALTMSPSAGPVLRNNTENDIQATALFYMDYEDFQDLEERLERLKEEKKSGGA